MAISKRAIFSNVLVPIGLLLIMISIIITSVLLLRVNAGETDRQSGCSFGNELQSPDSAVTEDFCSVFLIQNFSVGEAYSMISENCLELILPIICQCSTINDSLLQQLCSPKVGSNESIVCADGFYERSGVCHLNCLTFREVNDKTAITISVISYIAIGCSLILSLLFIIAAVIQRRTAFRFPSVLLIGGLSAFLPFVIISLISLIDGGSLMCSDEDIIESLKNPSPYCILSGILGTGSSITGWFFFVLVMVLFWKLVFPAHSHSHRHWEKWILSISIIIGIILPLPYIILSLADENFYFAPTQFPRLACYSRNPDVNLIYIYFQLIILPLIDGFVLVIILVQFQKRHGCTFWRKESVINTAEKKMLLMIMVVIFATMMNGILVSLRLAYTDEYQEALLEYIICEMTAYKNEESHCDKDDLERYSFAISSAVSLAIITVLTPAFFLVITIKWTGIIANFKKTAQVMCRKSQEERYSTQNFRLSSIG